MCWRVTRRPAAARRVAAPRNRAWARRASGRVSAMQKLGVLTRVCSSLLAAFDLFLPAVCRPVYVKMKNEIFSQLIAS
jgi:uncharacterized protein (DUF2342 family)